MPQDSLRSSVYRSFVTCDDPKGVIEGKTIKKSKIDPQNMEDNKVGKQRDIAKDLLKGALDLQESLVMLEKLQEASEYMTKLRKNQKDSVGKREFDGRGISRTKSERIADHRYNKVEFEKPRLSVDGGSRDCYDELREVIRDSLARQNLLPPCCASEKSCFDRRKVDLSPDFTSTSFTSSSESPMEKACVAGRKLVISTDFPSPSSSQSSMVQSQDCASFDCSPAKIQKEKPKVPNLIARLMGLEDVPSSPLHPTTRKQLEKDKVFKQRRPIFEIDLPKAKKPTFISQKADPKRRTLDGIIETMQFKGLLRRKPTEGSNNVTHQSSVSHFSKRFPDDEPPIVIMKPIYAPELQAERFPTGIHDENSSDAEETFGERNLKEENSAVNFTIYRKFLTQKVQNTSFSQEKGSKNHGEAPARPKTIQGKLPSTKNKASSPGKTKQPKNEAVEKRVERTQQTPSMKKSGETKNASSNDSAKIQNQSKMISAKVRKSERKSNTPEKPVVPPKGTISDPISNRNIAIASHNSRNRKKSIKTEKSVKNSSIVPVIDNMEHKDDNIQIVHAVDRDSDITITKVTSSEGLPFEEVTEIFEDVVTDNLNNGESLAAESTVSHIHSDHDIPLIEHTSYQIHLDSTEKENLKSRATTRHILLSSELFLSHAEELFDTDAWEPTVWQTISADDEMANSTVLLDCANEMLENKRSQCDLAVDPLSENPIKMSKISISFDKLVNEICDGIDVLRSYNKVADNTLSADRLYALHETDLWCNGVISTTWDLGWRNAFTLDEVDQVVTEIEKHLLNGIIDDVLTEFIL